MSRLFNLFRSIGTSRDWSTGFLLVLILAAAAWIAALPWSGTVRAATMRRYHLETSNFGAWALQQPIPAIYNFENRYWFHHHRLDLKELVNAQSPIESRMINHFPGRVFTFADQRHRLLGESRGGYLYMRSRYRGQDLWTVWRTLPKAGGGMFLVREEMP